jgi:transposase
MPYLEFFENKNKTTRVLLRESVRDGSKVKKITLANLSSLPMEHINALHHSLKGYKMVPASDIIEKIECTDTIPSGHVEAILTAVNRIGLPDLISPVSCPERDIVLGLIVARILKPTSKLYASKWWKTNALANELNLHDYDQQDAYKAMDWLFPKQPEIEKKLAARHLKEGDMVFVDVSSSYYEGEKSTLVTNSNVESSEEASEPEKPFITYGYSRDKKKGKKQINYSLLTDKEGRPVSIETFPGNTADTAIFIPTVEKIRNEFALNRVVMVGDRGMLSNKNITILKQMNGVDWITALRSTSIKKLIPEEGFNLGLFDERNLFEFTAPDEYPGERLIACRNPDLMVKRAKTRDDLLKATSEKLDKIKTRVKNGRLKKKDAIALAVGKVINSNKMKKHFILEIENSSFGYSLNTESIEAEKALDGIYVLRTSLPVEALQVEDCIRQYKNLTKVEKAFRHLKTVDPKIRHIDHYLDDRIRCHRFLAMLAYYVKLHLEET